MGKTSRFDPRWLQDPAYSNWLEAVGDVSSAKCKYCRTKFSLSNMGARALSSHMTGKKHREVMAMIGKVNLNSFLVKEKPPGVEAPKTSTIAEAPRTSNVGELPGSSAVQDPPTLASDEPAVHAGTPSDSAVSTVPKKKMYPLAFKGDVAVAELKWVLHCVSMQKSIRMSALDVEQIAKLFPDSSIAAGLQLSRQKITYMIIYGIAPFFRDELNTILKQSEYVVVGFDESLNKVSKRTQMDINVRFFCNNRVVTRYLTSAFLGHTTAKDIFDAFQREVLPLIDNRKIIQISMDGPSVNWKFLRDLKAYLKTSIDEDAMDNPVLLDIGSCGLHVVSNGFKVGIVATTWAIVTLLRAMYYLFKDSSARRADFVRYTSSIQFPLKFCGTRWLENVGVAERGIAVLPHLRTYVNRVQEEKIAPASSSFMTVKEAVNDPLLEAKLAFFVSFSNELNPFLRYFQSDDPLSPFLYDDLMDIMSNVMKRIIKPEKLRGSLAVAKMKLILEDKTSFLSPDKVELGFATNNALKKCIRNHGKIKDLLITNFRRDASEGLRVFCSKILEKSPLAYRLTRWLSCLNPVVAANPELGPIRLKSLLGHLVENNWLDGVEADRAAREYDHIRTTSLKKLTAYRRDKDRLDDFWIHINSSGDSPNLTKVIKISLSMSHGSANVERGFSVNSDTLVPNLSEELLVSRRLIYDTISTAGGVDKIEIGPALLRSVRGARMKERDASEKKKKESMEEEDAKKKRKANELLALEMMEKKEKLMKQAAELEVEIKNLGRKSL